jgi:3-isopropylmalate dehydratase small subunit
MDPFTRLESLAVPLDLPNIDTDQIIPARFLWRPRASGYGDALFNDLRHTPDGAPEPGFILNQPRYAGARILVAERNFGCGSSREQAVWALHDAGFRAVFTMAAFRRRQLLEGLDEIAFTLGHAAQIAAFEAAFETDLPWLAAPSP